MTEAEWLACDDPAAMLAFLRGKVSDRKLRLLACGLWRHSEHLRLSDQELDVVAAAERFFVDGQPLTGFLARQLGGMGVYAGTGQAAAEEALREYEGRWRQWPRDGWPTAWARLRAPVCRLLRDIVGNPFHPCVLAPDLRRWRGGLIESMAYRMYESRDFRELPVVADMLEDAGCRDEQVLAHCRGPGPHARGCFAIDLILSKDR